MRRFCGLDDRISSSPRTDKAVAANYEFEIAAELGWVLGG
jgi:hypothetical protein